MWTPREREGREGVLLDGLCKAAVHTCIMSILAATPENVKELMGHLKKFVDTK